MLRTKYIVILLSVLFLGVSAFAEPVNITFVGPEGTRSGGQYVYPYEFTINGSSNTVNLMCISYDRTVTPGQTFQANSTTIPLDFGMLSIQYRAAAQLLYIADRSFHGLNTTYSTGDAQWAAWGVFNSDARRTSGYTQGEAAELTQLAFRYALDPSITNSGFYSQFTLYKPFDTSSRGPQQLLGYNPTPVPEPASLALVGAGLSVIGILRRRMKK